jgi:hypothetical protein
MKQKVIDKFNSLWTPKHFQFLLQCFKKYKDYYEGCFDTLTIQDDVIIADNVKYTQKEIKEILINYYLNIETPTCFGDVVYMFFTDLVDKKYNILGNLE